MDFLFRQLIYFAFFQAIILIAIYGVVPKVRKKINGYLLILVILLFVGLCGHIFYMEGLFGGYRKWSGFSEFSILFFGPTIYLFFRAYLQKKRFDKRDLIHYIPGVIYCLFVTFYYLLAPPQLINERIESGQLYRVIHVMVGTGLIVNSSYYILTIKNFLAGKKHLQSNASFVLPLQFLRNFLVVIGICLATWLTVYILSLSGMQFAEIDSRKFIWVAIALMILFILYYQLISPSTLDYQRLFASPKYAQSKLTSLDLDRLKADLEKVMEMKKPYLNAKLLKAELADMLDLNAPELSRLLNERIGMSFFEFVNYYRIQEFIQLAKTSKSENLTLLALAQESGFNSKATFNKSFKKIMGCTPSEYLRK